MDIAKSYPKSMYLNYDNLKDRKIIKSQEWLDDTDLLILDEIHKMKGWKNLIKGVFDTKPCSLNYLRTKDKAEIDFCIAGKHAPEMMIEAKLSDETPGKSIINFNRRYGILGIQLVMKLKQERKENNIEIRSAARYLSSLMMEYLRSDPVYPFNRRNRNGVAPPE